MMKKWILIMVVLMTAVLNIFAETGEKLELTGYSGKLSKTEDTWFLNTGEEVFPLSLAPDEFLKVNEIELVSELELTVTGIRQEDVFVVYTLLIAESELKLRNELGEILWPYHVDPKGCIGCRLCVKRCPYGAISMQKGIAVIDMEKCTGCGICANGDGKRYKGCPVDVIKQTE